MITDSYIYFLLLFLTLASLLRLLLLKIHERRILIWMFSFGFQGVFWWCAFLLVNYNRAYFYDLISVPDFLVVFSAASVGGFLVWFHSLKTKKFACRVEDISTLTLSVHREPPVYSAALHLRVFSILLLFFGLAAIAALHIFIFVFIGVSGYFFFYPQPALNIYGNVLDNLLLFLKLSYLCGFPVLVVVHFLTLRLLRLKESRWWVWITFYAAFGFILGSISAKLFIPFFVRDITFILRFPLALSAFSVMIAVLTGFMMWVYCRNMKLPAVLSHETVRDGVHKRTWNSAIKALGVQYFIIVAVLLSLPIFVFLSLKPGAFIFIMRGVVFAHPLFVIGAGLAAFLAGLGERRLQVWVAAYALGGAILWLVFTYVFMSWYVFYSGLLSVKFFYIVALGASIGTLLCLFCEVIDRRREVLGSAWFTSRRVRTLFRGRVLLNLLSAFGILTIFSLPIFYDFYKIYSPLCSEWCPPEVFRSFFARFFVSFLYGLWPLVLMFFVSLYLIGRKETSLSKWFTYFSGIGFGSGLFLWVLGLFGGVQQIWYNGLAFMICMPIGTGLLMWQFFVRSYLRNENLRDEVKKLEEIEMGGL